MFQTTNQIKRSEVETGYPLLLKRAIDNRLSHKTWWFFMAMLDCTLWSTMENRPFTCDLPLRKWWFSTAMLVYTRVDDLFFFLWSVIPLGDEDMLFFFACCGRCENLPRWTNIGYEHDQLDWMTVWPCNMSLFWCSFEFLSETWDSLWTTGQQGSNL